MIIGNGDIAKALKGIDDDKIYFASGISNSLEIRESEFKRERYLLNEQDRRKRLVYFSSLSVFYSDTPYAKHKKSMEEFVKFNWNKYTILRLGNINWGNNPHTIINYLKNKIETGETLELQSTYRYIIDKKELLYWIGMIPDFNCEMNIPGKRMHVTEIAAELAKHGKIVL